MKPYTIKSTLFTTLVVLSLTACTPTTVVNQPIHILNSGNVLFTNIITEKVKNGLKVSGNVRKKSQSGKRVRIPGHIHIISKDKDGKILETIQARTHRKFGNSKTWHFDGVLKTLSTRDGEIAVKYHGRHSN